MSWIITYCTQEKKKKKKQVWCPEEVNDQAYVLTFG